MGRKVWARGVGKEGRWEGTLAERWESGKVGVYKPKMMGWTKSAPLLSHPFPSPSHLQVQQLACCPKVHRTLNPLALQPLSPNLPSPPPPPLSSHHYPLPLSPASPPAGLSPQSPSHS